MQAIFKNLEKIFEFDVFSQYKGKDVMLLLGGNSYKFDKDTFMPIFPNLDIKNVIVIPGAGHWVHSEKPKETINAISDFLINLDSKTNYATSSIMYSI